MKEWLSDGLDFYDQFRKVDFKLDFFAQHFLALRMADSNQDPIITKKKASYFG